MNRSTASWVELVVSGIALGLVLVLLILDLAYFVRGSLEELPMPEDHAKVRTLTGVLAFPLAGAAVVLRRWVLHTVREGREG